MGLTLMGNSIIQRAQELADEITALENNEAIEVLNSIRLALHSVSPFKDEPVDCVLWVPADTVEANDYNPNVVAPPEMRLLKVSIGEDGYTQPLVTWQDDGHREVVDGFHRYRIGTEDKEICKRILGYLPVTTVNEWRTDRSDRIASTIRHNRARGKHLVQGMSEIVVELSRRNHSDEWIARELGMDQDEVLRLKQISGLAEMFAEHEFSEAWEVDNE